MKFRTGDILIWRSTIFFDMLGENTILLPGFHSGVILMGPEFAPYSRCGPSPSHTYTTFLIDQIFPVEEVVGHVWTKANGSSLDIIQRIDGRDIPSKEALEVYLRFKRLKKLNPGYTTYLAVAAYFRYGGLMPGTGHKGYRYHFCPSTVSFFLDQFNLLYDNSDLNSLLPRDFYYLDFYQKDCYRRVPIFDKRTNEFSWWILSPLINLGLIDCQEHECPLINQIMGNYDYPRTSPTGKLLRLLSSFSSPEDSSSDKDSSMGRDSSDKDPSMKRYSSLERDSSWEKDSPDKDPSFSAEKIRGPRKKSHGTFYWPISN